MGQKVSAVGGERRREVTEIKVVMRGNMEWEKRNGAHNLHSCGMPLRLTATHEVPTHFFLCI